MVMALETTLPKASEALEAVSGSTVVAESTGELAQSPPAAEAVSLATAEANGSTTVAASTADVASTADAKIIGAEQPVKIDDSSELVPSPESSLEAPSSAFDSTDPAVANLPTVFDSSEIEGPRVFSSSHEPGLHVPHFQDEEPTLYIRKTLRSGQRVMFAGNVVLLGDLNPGAQIEADGDVIVLGQLRGSVHAGCEGDEQATVITSSLRATQLRIADRFYKAESASRFFRKSSPTGTLRARLDGETVVVEALPAR